MMTVIKRMIFVFLVFASISFAAVDYNQPLTSDSETIALWHMDSINREVVDDINKVNLDDIKNEVSNYTPPAGSAGGCCGG